MLVCDRCRRVTRIVDTLTSIDIRVAPLQKRREILDGVLYFTCRRVARRRQYT